MARGGSMRRWAVGFRSATFGAAALGLAWCRLAIAAGSEAAVNAAPAEPGGKSLWQLFRQTGPVGWMLLILSAVGTALLIQYLLRYTSQRLVNRELLEQAQRLLAQGDSDAAYELARTDETYAGKVLAGALERRSGGYHEVKESLFEASSVEAFRINAKVSNLSLVGNIGPLLGLLGTVTGMISSFQVIETLKAPTPGDLAKGVYESLVNTTIGLFIAIVFLSSYFFLKNKISDLLLQVNSELANVIANSFVEEPAAGTVGEHA